MLGYNGGAMDPLCPMPRSPSVHIAVPLLVGAFAILSEYSGLDLRLASLFYDPVAGQWPYRDLFLTSDVLHTGAKNFVVLIALGNLLAIACSYVAGPLTPYRKHLVYLFVAAVTGPIFVSTLKGMTHIYTPWDITMFGGAMPYTRLFDPVPAGAAIGHAFPGGHSSGGFAYLSLYFLLAAQRHRLRYYGLLPGLVLGIVFALTQEVRGAHFLSHDLFSFVICWTASMLWAPLFFRRWARGASSLSS